MTVVYSYLVYFAVFVTTSICDDNKVFRSDYEYYVEADGWFKLHRMPLNWEEARLICAYEGAMLASPTTYGLTTVIRSFTDKHKISVFTGIHATVSNGVFLSLVVGIPLSEIPVKWPPGNPNNHENTDNCIIYLPDGSVDDIHCYYSFPFICYKKHSNDLVMTECGTTDKAYKKDLITNKCYKFHRMGKIHSVAAAICTSEGGHLAIINSEEEADALRNLFARNPASDLKVSYPDLIRLGFYNWNGSNFFGTLDGQSLEEAGYAVWSEGQPTHYHEGKPQRCGGMFRNGYLDDTTCSDTLAFVCEKDPETLTKSTIDTRFGQQQ